MRSRPVHRLAVIGIAAVHLVAGLILLTPAWIRPDSVMEYAFVRSALLDRDFLFFNEWAHFGMIRDGVTMTKEVNNLSILVNHGWVGTSLLVAPQYALSLLLTRSDGFSGIAGAVLAWSTVAFASAVSVLIFLMFEQAVPALSVGSRLFVVAAITVGTPLLWYEYRFPLGTHVAGALCIALLTGWLMRLLDGEDVSAFVIGMLLGLAIVTRLQHVVLAPAAGLALLRSRRPAVAFPAAIAGSLLPGSVQAMVWWITYGNPLGPLVGGANASGGTWSPFREVAVIPVLFSSYHGLFTWAPVTLLAIIGLVVGLRGARSRFALVLLLMFLGELVANSAFDRFWWAGMSFGPRRFTDLAAVFGIGLAWLLAASASSRFSRIVSIAATVVASGWTCSLASAAIQRQLDLSADVTPKALFRSAVAGAGWTHGELRSTLTDSGFLRESLLALIILAIVSASIAAIARSRASVHVMAAYFVLSLLFCASLWNGTRARAREEASRYGIDPGRASRMGPLLDQRNLLREELDYYLDRGRTSDAQATKRELAQIDSLIQSLGGFRRDR